MTLKELRTRVCERLGIADLSGEVAAPTTDTIELDRVDRAIHDATRSLWRAIDPRTGRAANFSFTTPTISFEVNKDGTSPLAIGGDAGRYRLPRGVSSAPIGRLTWSESSNSGSSGVIRTTSIDEIIRLRASSPTSSGPPVYAAVWSIQDDDIRKGERPGFEMRLWPKPDRTMTITGRFRVEPVRLVNEEDRGNWPAAHDLTIVELAIDILVRGGGITSAPDRQEARVAAERALIESIEHDYLVRPPSVGNLGMSEDGPPAPYTLTTKATLSDGTVISFGG